MADEIRAYTLTIPAGTTPAAPVIANVVQVPRQVDAVQVIVPPGPSGFVGWCIMNSRLRVIPYQSDDWIITAGESITWPLSGYITSGDWQVAGYNTGSNDHSVYFRFLLSLVGGHSAQVPGLIDEADLTPADFTLFSYGGN